MATAAETRDYLTKTYLAAFLRAPELSGLNYWSSEVLVSGKTLTQVGGTIFSIDIVTQIYPVALTDKQFVEAIYHNVFGKAGEPAGITYWTDELVALRSANTSDNAFFEARGQLVFNMIQAGLATPDGTPGKDYIVNRLTAANDAVDQQFAAAGDVAPADLAAVMSTVNADDATVVASHNAIATLIAGVEPIDFSLTLGQDTILGNGQDNIFHADLAQAGLIGNVSNTLESGDFLDGLAGRDELHASLAPTVIGTLPIGPTIQAVTQGIEEVYLHAQFPNVLDTTIDAGRMIGVEQWWSDESRSSIFVEDIRSVAKDTTFGMRGTDAVDYNFGAPVVSSSSFYAAFDPLQMNKASTPENSSMTITMVDAAANPATPLAGISIDGFAFTFKGVAYSVRSDAMANADTYPQFVTALEAALAANPALAGLDVVLNVNNTITVTDPAGGIFNPTGVTFLGNVVPPVGSISWNVVPGQPVDVDQPIETNIVLDNVGRSAQGGEMVVGSMATGGVDVFNVKVGANSWLSALASQSFVDPLSSAIPLPLGQENVLDTVNVGHLNLGATSSLTIGETTVDPTSGVSTTDDDRVSTAGFISASLLAPGGLQDVRVFNAAGFDGEIKLAADINSFTTDKYLAVAPTQFSYLLGDNNDNLTLRIENEVAADADFKIEVMGGAGDDRFNLGVKDDDNSGEADTYSNITLDGGTGENTLAVSISSTAFESFKNIQHVIVEGFNDGTIHDMDNYPGVKDIKIATEGYDQFGNELLPRISTEVRDLGVDMDLTISGMNQTLGTGNSNIKQFFGIITVRDAKNPDLDITLENTARINAQLSVEQLLVTGNASAAKTVNLLSNGQRDTSNVVRDFQGDKVEVLNLKGTQDLAVHVSSIAGTPVGLETVDATINASTLTGDLVLAVNAAELDGDADDTITGTAGTKDVLALYAVDPDGTTESKISGFETVQFGWLENSTLDGFFVAPTVASGIFDAENTTGVNTYVIGNVGINTTFGIDSLRSGNVIQLGDTSVNPGAETQQIYTGASLDLTFTGNGTNPQDSLVINTVKQLDDSQFELGEVAFDINNVKNVTMNFDRSLNGNDNELIFFTVDLDDDARSLIITGGDSAETGHLINADTGPVFGKLNTSLIDINVSGFKGHVVMGTWDSLKGSNATVTVGEYGFWMDLGGDNTVGSVAPGANNIYEIHTVDFALAGGPLAVGESVTFTFAGSSYTFTNSTAAAITAANLNAAIIADGAIAGHAPAGFSIADAGGLIQLTAKTYGDMTGVLDLVVTDTSVLLGAPLTAEATAGDTSSVTGFDLVETAPEFISNFDFNTDAAKLGYVWQIDNFMAFEAGVNIGLNNQSIIDLRGLGVNSAADIKVQTATDYWASLTAAQQTEFDLNFADAAPDAFGIPQTFLTAYNASDVVVSSNEGLKFAIVLTGVQVADIVNENIAGIA